MVRKNAVAREGGAYQFFRFAFSFEEKKTFVCVVRATTRGSADDRVQDFFSVCRAPRALNHVTVVSFVSKRTWSSSTVPVRRISLGRQDAVDSVARGGNGDCERTVVCALFLSLRRSKFARF